MQNFRCSSFFRSLRYCSELFSSETLHSRQLRFSHDQYYEYNNKSQADILEDARARLGSLGGGSVVSHLNNDTGLATITVQHGQKKNAFSGRSCHNIVVLVANV